MAAKRHHYVPRCYLKNFAVVRKKGKHQVCVFDREARKTFQAAIENVAVEKDFNRIDIEGIEPDAFEKGMAELEAEASPAIERTVSAGSFANDDDRAYVLNLIGLLALRKAAAHLPRHLLFRLLAYRLCAIGSMSARCRLKARFFPESNFRSSTVASSTPCRPGSPCSSRTTLKQGWIQRRC
jgi:hypothetical protein